MEGLGALGFWLALGLFLGAGAIAGAIKEIAKEREKQATLRALLSGTSESMPEVLAYLREKDAAEAARAHAQWIAMGGNMSGRSAAAFAGAAAVGGASFLGGVLSFAHLGGSEARFLPIATMFGIWAGGFLLALLIVAVFRERKKAPPPGA